VRSNSWPPCSVGTILNGKITYILDSMIAFLLVLRRFKRKKFPVLFIKIVNKNIK